MNLEAHFKVLGLSSSASWDEVKTAFRRLALKYHPDVVGPDGARRFAEITEAYVALKETISPGAGRTGGRYRSTGDDDPEVVTVERGPSFLSRLWQKIKAIFSFSRPADNRSDEVEYDFDMSPARERFIGSIITKAETDIHMLMSRRGEVKNKAETEAILSRVASRHPSVTMLALKRISIRDASPELRRGVMEHFKKNPPASEVLECLINLFSNSSYSIELARLLAAHSKAYTDADALMLVKWYRRINAPKECFAAMLSGPSMKAAAAAISAWPAGASIGDMQDTVRFLRSGDESVLVPLLKLMKRERLSGALAAAVRDIATSSTSPAVKVWASAIVREQNLS